MAVYCEFFYRAEGQDVGFDLETGQFGVDGLVGLNAKNASSLIALAECDIGISPTPWQRSTFPHEFQPKIHVAHEGVDTDLARARPRREVRCCPAARGWTGGDEVVTYFARGLEPMRGFHVFMRALPEILRARPQRRDRHRRRPRRPPTATRRPTAAAGSIIACARRCRRSTSPASISSTACRTPSLRALMQVSTVHVYLTYPFVLSWSCIEALSAGCAIVASDTAPVRDVIVDGENGVLTPFHDPRALAAAVCDLLADPARRARLSQSRARDGLAGFDIEPLRATHAATFWA